MQGRAGDAGFCERSRFRADPRLRLDGVPPEVFLVLPFHDVILEGRVDYHAAFFQAVDEPR
jgi:putative acetyltransferase